jgi:APA family basic amino acid/polyamine antiporter
MNQAKKYTLTAAISVVVANMIGTGVFTSLGFQLLDFPAGIPDAFTILLLWFTGGIIALCGAFVYAEVATTLKESGGEYLFLSRIYHPSLGFASAFISLFAGFAAPVCANAIALGTYSSPIFGFNDTDLIFIAGFALPLYKIVSIAVIIILSLVHIAGVKTGGAVQTILTLIKLGLIIFFCTVPFFIGNASGVKSFAPTNNSYPYTGSLAFAGALVYVMYAYSGWNATAYIAGNVINPLKNIPRSIITGTLLVTAVYISLNAMFLYAAPMDSLKGKYDIGNEVALYLFGSDVGVIFSGLFSLALVSTISSMIIAGPRVLEKVGQDYPVFYKLTKNSAGGTPVNAIILQSSIAIVMVLFSNLGSIIEYISITLLIFSLLTVFGVFLLRKRLPQAEKFKTPLYPITPVIFIIATLWMIIFFAMQKPLNLVYSGGTILLGLLLYIYALKKPNGS